MPLLTVLIPTYNRGDLLEALVDTVVPALRDAFSSEFEVVISDNHSPDSTAAICNGLQLRHGEVLTVKPPVHLPTAEENLAFALPHCKGKFVWLLGDDDSVERFALQTLRRLVDEDQLDLLIFNSRSHSHDGRILKQIRVPCLSRRVEMELLEFVRRTGFWFVISGFSTTVFRRSCADPDQLAKVLGIGKIYAHVTWLLAQFHNKRFAFVNEPLVSYRQNISDVKATGHWENVAKREKLFHRAIWTTGFLRQVDFLVHHAIVERGFLRSVLDRNLESRFYFVDEMLRHILDSCIEWFEGRADRIPQHEFVYFCEWAIDMWPENITIVANLKKLMVAMYEDQRLDRSALDAAAQAFNDRILRPWWWRFHLYDTQSFSIFRHGARWFAIRSDWEEDAIPWLAYLDFESCAPFLWVASTEEELLSMVSEQLSAERRASIQPTDAASGHANGHDLGRSALVRGGFVQALASPIHKRGITGLEPDRKVRSAEPESPLGMHAPTSVVASVLEAELLEARAKSEAYSQAVEALRSSTSWRVTAPLRTVGNLFRRKGRETSH